jgi:hypothetical protein
VTVNGDLGGDLAKVKADVEAHGGVFEGDLSSGSLSGPVPLLGSFQASYTVSDSTVTIQVTKRPLLVSCSVIESQVRGYFSTL